MHCSSEWLRLRSPGRGDLPLSNFSTMVLLNYLKFHVNQCAGNVLAHVLGEISKSKVCINLVIRVVKEPK